MQISASFVRSLVNGFGYFSERDLVAQNHQIEDSNLVKTFITVPKGCNMIPLTVHGGYFPRQEEKSEVYTATDVIYPLYVGYQEVHRTTDSILKSLILPPRAGRLTKVTTSKGEVFYGGQGVILEEDGTPILLIKAVYDKDLYRYTKGELYISPKVFAMDNTVYKGILSKIVPVYTGLVNNHGLIKLKVLVEDIQGFSKPQLINHSIRESCQAASRFLKDNIDHVF